MPGYIPYNAPTTTAFDVLESKIKDAAGLIFIQRTTFVNGAPANVEYFDAQGNPNNPTFPLVSFSSPDTVPAGSSPPITGGDAQLVTIDVNSSPIKIDVAKGSDNTDLDTIRTVTALDSQDVALLNAINIGQTDGGQVTRIGDGNINGLKARVVNTVNQADGALPGLMVARSSSEYFEKVDNFVATAAIGATPINTAVRRTTRLDMQTGAIVKTMWHAVISGTFVTPTPVIGTNVTFVSGGTNDTNVGNVGANTLRTVAANDSPEITRLAEIRDKGLAIESGTTVSISAPIPGLIDGAITIIAKGQAVGGQIVLNSAATCTYNVSIYRPINAAGDLEIAYTTGAVSKGAGLFAIYVPAVRLGYGGRFFVRLVGVSGAAASVSAVFNWLAYDQPETSTIKTAGESATLSDNAVVVSLSPNSIGLQSTVSTSGYQRITNGSVFAEVKATTPAAADAGLVTLSSPSEYAERQDRFITTVGGAVPIGSLVNRTQRFTSTGTLVSTVFHRISDSLFILSADTAVSTGLTSQAVGEPNQSIATAAFTKLTDGVDVLDFKNVFPGNADFGLPTRSIPDGAGNTQIVGATTGTLVYTRLTDGTSVAVVTTGLPATGIAGQVVRQGIIDADGNTALVGKTATTKVFSQLTNGTISPVILAASVAPAAIDQSLVVSISPNTPDLKPNRTATDAAFSKVTDGTNTTTVKAANTPAALADTSLVVNVSPNSPFISPLAPSTVATRHLLTGGQFLTTAPTLTDLQQAPLLFNNRGALAVTFREQTVITGQVNPTADTLLTAGKKLYRIVYTNNSAIVHFLQLHSSAAALATGAVPNFGTVYRVPANSTFVLDATTFGESGETLPGSPRLAISTTFGTYTAAVAGNLAIMSLNIKQEA